jgi:CHAD domain-containing protein
MTYHLDPEAELTESVREVARDQISKAAGSLRGADDDLEEAIHDARKRFKKIRGLLRLVRPGLGGRYGKENKAFRDLGRRLSPVRDAQVMAETVEKLEKDAAAPGVAEQLVPLHAWIAERRERVLSDTDAAERAAKVADALEKAERRAGRWKVEGAPAAVLSEGLKKTYKRARRRGGEATLSGDADLFHEWRKRAKYHWYHTRLLREAWPDQMKARAEALDDLGDDLGDDHDLVVLVRTLREAKGLPQDLDRGLVETLAAERSQRLRREALTRAPALFVETPGAHARRIAGLWTQAAALRAA